MTICSVGFGGKEGPLLHSPSSRTVRSRLSESRVAGYSPFETKGINHTTVTSTKTHQGSDFLRHTFLKFFTCRCGTTGLLP